MSEIACHVDGNAHIAQRRVCVTQSNGGQIVTKMPLGGTGGQPRNQAPPEAVAL